jgi:hypothetical protein
MKIPRARCNMRRGEYMTGTANDIPSGMIYFKRLMMKAEVDLRAMALHICNNLGSLDTYMYTTANSNIANFNNFIQDEMAALNSWGETTHNLLNNLFKARL